MIGSSSRASTASSIFMRRMEAANKDVSELDEVRVCAIGDATALRLAEAHATSM